MSSNGVLRRRKLTDETIAEAVSKAVNAKPEKEPMPVAPCPCGAQPGGLMIEMPERAKYGIAMGDCCGVWMVEFRNGYTQDRDMTLRRAHEAWNNAPRPAIASLD